jgi:enamine deaminase RidA (YjgF/YER057c/UK114 family)
MADRINISSGTVWEQRVGYSRAVRIGGLVFVAGTLAVDEAGAVVGPGDAREQTRYALMKIERALLRAGASRRDVVRTRMYIRRIEDQEAVGAAHAEFFGDVMPAATMIEVGRFAHPDGLVEIEADAVLRGGHAPVD